ncbi:MAG TPA: hypothetical protein VKE69_14145 [Planctomycetota bacterium]|nr:hypothetical protein [Planctomycetota bacterium]
MNPKNPDPGPAKTPPEKKDATKGARQTAPEDAKPPAPKPFVFKIVRADPKNSIDFEDVADK